MDTSSILLRLSIFNATSHNFPISDIKFKKNEHTFPPEGYGYKLHTFNMIYYLLLTTDY